VYGRTGPRYDRPFMRALFFLVFGVACGVIGTVLLFTLDTSFHGNQREEAGGGNARISLDEDALARLIERQLPSLAGFGAQSTVKVNISENGLIEVTIGLGVPPVGLRGTITLNPDVVDGRLAVRVVGANLGGAVAPEQIARLVEAPLQERLDGLAAGLDYRLTSIATTEHRLTLEVTL